MEEYDARSCANCTARACESYGESGKKAYPDFCLTERTPDSQFSQAVHHYQSDEETSRIFQAAAATEGLYYGRLTRVEEIIVFARELGAKKIGIACCMGLLNEAQAFAKIVRAKGLQEVCAVVCKVGSIEKEQVGIAEDLKVHPGCFEPTCNPLMQARILNEAGCDLNVIMGLCVGHDTLFIKHAEAPVTYLVVKDRVLAHNPAGALYTKGSFYKRLLSPDLPQPRPRSTKD